MQFTNYTINAKGLAEIKTFLAANHKKSKTQSTLSKLRAWAAVAEFQLSNGNPAVIDIKSSEAMSGQAETFTVSADGIDVETVTIEIKEPQGEGAKTMKLVKTNGNRAVVIIAQNFSVWACLYVNAKQGIEQASITQTRWTGKTTAGALRWAEKQLAQTGGA